MEARLCYAVSFTALAFAANWLVCGASSPLREHFVAHETFPHWWALANAAPPVVAEAIAINLRGRAGALIYNVLFAAQWCAAGCAAASVAVTLRSWFWKPR